MKLFALTIFLTDYILAAAMVWVAVCAHFGRPLPETVLFLPLTNILLLPQLRASMPGVPDFGRSQLVCMWKMSGRLILIFVQECSWTSSATT